MKHSRLNRRPAGQPPLDTSCPPVALLTGMNQFQKPSHGQPAATLHKTATAEATPKFRAPSAFAAKLTFEAVERRYEDHMALKGVSLEIAPGEVVCLLGPSGCGKTTLLRIASGIEKPSGGRVLINDQEVAGPNRFVPPEKRNVGLMFQDFALFPHLSILDNVAFGLRALPREEAIRQALVALSRVGLKDYAEDFPHILSGGQQQRVALARAIVPRPSVVLMDEPFSGLDVQLRDSMQEETLALLRETRATCMIVTHHPEEAMRLGDRVAVMLGGQIIQAGPAEELYRQPANLFVARLFSQINEIPAVVQGGEIDTPIGRLPAKDMPDGSPVTWCIRRRSILINSGEGGLPGRILHVKFLGDMALIEVGVQGFEDPLHTLVHESQEPKQGAEVRVSIDPASVLIFPAEE